MPRDSPLRVSPHDTIEAHYEKKKKNPERQTDSLAFGSTETTAATAELDLPLPSLPPPQDAMQTDGTTDDDGTLGAPDILYRIPKPDNWASMSNTNQKHWRRRHRK